MVGENIASSWGLFIWGRIVDGKSWFICIERFFLKAKYPLKYPQDKDNKRPFYLAIKDDDKEGICWVIPLSSKLDKYEEIKKKYPDSVIIDYLYGGNRSAILIQNAVPIQSIDFERPYTVNGVDFVIKNSGLIDDINNKVGRVISLIKHKNIRFFAAAKAMYKDL